MIKKITIVLLTLLMLISFLSCNDWSGNENTTESNIDNNIFSDFVNLTNNGQAIFKVIRPDLADDTVVQQAIIVLNTLEEKTGISFELDNDWVKNVDKVENDEYEILVGDTNRVETSLLCDQLGFAEYGIEIINKKIVIAGKTNATLSYAVDLFISMLEEGTNANAKADISLPSNTKIINKFNKLDFPVYNSGELSGIYDCGDGAYEYYITRTNEAEYIAYCEFLEENGFINNGNNKIKDNLFNFYVKDNSLVYTYYVPYRNAVRIIRENEYISLPSDTNYKKVTESSIAQLSLDYSEGENGMGYIIKLEDGSYFIVDGGYKKDADKLYNYLLTNNTRADGKIVIAAWLITHSHNDHYLCFDTFASKYGSRTKLEYLIFNHFSKSAGPTDGLYSEYLLKSYKGVISNFPGVKIIKPHTGYRITIRNAVLEVLFTHEDLFPKPLAKLNNASLVSRLTIAGQTFMLLGDAQYDASDIICDMYGDYLKSDIVQISHHGGLGGTKQLYGLIDPSVAFWPSSQKIYESEKDTRVVNVYLLKELNLKELFVGFEGNKVIVLPYIPK